MRTAAVACAPMPWIAENSPNQRGPPVSESTRQVGWASQGRGRASLAPGTGILKTARMLSTIGARLGNRAHWETCGSSSASSF